MNPYKGHAQQRNRQRKSPSLVVTVSTRVFLSSILSGHAAHAPLPAFAQYDAPSSPLHSSPRYFAPTLSVKQINTRPRLQNISGARR